MRHKSDPMAVDEEAGHAEEEREGEWEEVRAAGR